MQCSNRSEPLSPFFAAPRSQKLLEDKVLQFPTVSDKEYWESKDKAFTEEQVKKHTQKYGLFFDPETGSTRPYGRFPRSTVRNDGIDRDIWTEDYMDQYFRRKDREFCLQHHLAMTDDVYNIL